MIETQRLPSSTQDRIEGCEVLTDPDVLAESLAENFTLEKSKVVRNLVDAWVHGSYIDERGGVWLDGDRLAQALIVKAFAELSSFHPEQHDFVFIDGKTWVRGEKVRDLLKLVIRDSDNSCDYARASRQAYLKLRDSNQAKERQDCFAEQLDQTRERLKKRRIRRNRLLDELTNDPLDAETAEFAYVRNPSFYPELTEFDWNGVVVDRNTFEFIRKSRPADEDDFWRYFREISWEGILAAWAYRYGQSLRSFYLNP